MASASNHAADDLAAAFAAESGGLAARKNVNASSLTTMHVGGPVACLVDLQNPDDAPRAVAALLRLGKPYRILGAGSNVLAADEGVSELVLRLGKGFRDITTGKDGRFIVGAGASLMTVSRQLSEAGFSGLEFAGGIPASIGGAVRMNAGAHGGEISNVLEEIEGVTAEGRVERIAASSIAFAYRRCPLPHDFLVTRAVLRLTPGDARAAAARRTEYLAERKARQPLSLPSSGSVFKNPLPDRTAGRLIEEAGLKGRREGGAQISELHGNWIVNPDRSASFKDVCALIALCQDTVREKFGISLEPEVIRWT